MKTKQMTIRFGDNGYSFILSQDVHEKLLKYCVNTTLNDYIKSIIASVVLGGSQIIAEIENLEGLMLVHMKRRKMSQRAWLQEVVTNYFEGKK